MIMIKQIIIAALLLLSGSVYSAVSFNKATYIYYHLVAANHIKGAPALVLDPDMDVNAASNSGITIITLGMLIYAKNDDEIARVLGHELGHFTLHHQMSSVPNEYAADAMAMRFMVKAGYNKCLGAQLLKRRNATGGTDHPDDILRYRRFNCGA